MNKTLRRIINYSVFWISVLIQVPVIIYYSLKEEFLCSLYEFRDLKQRIEERDDDEY